MKKYNILLFLAVALLLSCFLFPSCPNVQAAEQPYEINITKTTPSKAEKKLRKVRAGSKRLLYLKVKATSQKDAKKKIKSWLKKFQDLKANRYGILPVVYNPKHYSCTKSGTKGYYLYGELKNPFYEHSQKIYLSPSGVYTLSGYASDYVNLNTICRRAIKDWLSRDDFAFQYGANYFDYMNNFTIFYKSASHPEIYGAIPAYFSTYYYEAEKYGIFGKSIRPSTLKKQSDSFRTEFYRTCISGISWKNGPDIGIRLYDVAQKKGFGVCVDLAQFTFKFLQHFTLDCEAETIQSDKEMHMACIWRAKGADGNWDYFEANNEHVYTVRNSSSLSPFTWMESGEIKTDSSLRRGFYRYMGNGSYSEAGQVYLQSLIRGSKPKIEAFIRNELSGVEEPQRIEYQLINNNKNKCGIQAMTGSFTYAP